VPPSAGIPLLSPASLRTSFIFFVIFGNVSNACALNWNAAIPSTDISSAKRVIESSIPTSKINCAVFFVKKSNGSFCFHKALLVILARVVKLKAPIFKKSIVIPSKEGTQDSPFCKKYLMSHYSKLCFFVRPRSPSSRG